MFWEKFYNLCESKNTKPLIVVKTLSIATGSITKWKNGTIPNGKTLQKLADYFNVSVDYLLSDQKEKPGTEATPPELNEDLKTITEILKSLPPEKVKEIENYALFVSKQQNQ